MKSISSNWGREKVSWVMGCSSCIQNCWQRKAFIISVGSVGAEPLLSHDTRWRAAGECLPRPRRSMLLNWRSAIDPRASMCQRR